MEKFHKLIYPALAAAIMFSPASVLADDGNTAAIDSLGNEIELAFRNASPEEIFGGVSQVNVV